MLRSHAELVGLQSNFTIIDTDDQIRLIKQLITAANLDEKRWPARQFAGLIDRWKNRGWTPADIDAAESEAFANGRGQELYAQYHGDAGRAVRQRNRQESTNRRRSLHHSDDGSRAQDRGYFLRLREKGAGLSSSAFTRWRGQHESCRNYIRREEILSRNDRRGHA
jgi:hypothetical protein